MKIAVVSAITGAQKKLDITYPVIHKECDYFFFTDTPKAYQYLVDKNIDVIPLYSNSWDDVYSARRSAKLPKTMTHHLLPKYDIYVWHDATNCLSASPDTVLECLENADCAMFKHPFRDCVYDEASVILQHKIDHPSLVKDTVSYLRANKFPSHFGLFEMTAFIRRNNEQTNRAFTEWFSLISRYSSRDQLTFMPCLKEHALRVNQLKGNAQRVYGNNDILPQIQDSLRVSGVVRNSYVTSTNRKRFRLKTFLKKKFTKVVRRSK